jgi:uncharacterized cupredoxin-like copper-binding protein
MAKKPARGVARRRGGRQGERTIGRRPRQPALAGGVSSSHADIPPRSVAMVKVLVVVMLAAVLSSPAFLPAANAAAPQVVAITLQDASGDPSMKGMVIKAEPATVKAGRVTLEVVNRSRTLVHEVLVVPALAEGKEMPYDAKKDTVVEKRVHPLGEVSDLKPGARGKLTLTLKPGTYLLLCIQPGHFKSGMSTRLVVEK